MVGMFVELECVAESGLVVLGVVMGQLPLASGGEPAGHVCVAL